MQASAGHPVSGLPLAVGGGYGDCRIPGEEAFLEGLVVSPLSSLILWIGAAVMSAVVVVWMAVRGSRQRRAMLRERYGPEYDRLFEVYGRRGRAERELIARARGGSEPSLGALAESDRLRFSKAYQALQARFVDDPAAAVVEADDLVRQLLAARGVPSQRLDEGGSPTRQPSNLLERYRAARAILAEGQANQAGTEQLRQAFVHYRALFGELLEEPRGRAAGLREAHAT